MKTLNFDITALELNDFILSTEEMICVRGGDMEGEPISKPVVPPIKI